MQLHEEKNVNTILPSMDSENQKQPDPKCSGLEEESKHLFTNLISKLSNHSEEINKSEINPFHNDFKFKSKTQVADDHLLIDDSQNRRYTPKSIDKGKALFRNRYIKNNMNTIKEAFQYKPNSIIAHSCTNKNDMKNSQFEEEKKKQKYTSVFLKKTEKAIFSFNLKKYEDSFNELINSGIIKSEEEFAEFLLVITGFDKYLIGEFLSKEKPPNKGLAILRAYMNKIDFTNVPFMDAFRFLFTRLNLPKDSSLILTIIDEFTQAYYNDNKQSSSFADANALYLLCSCVLAINTMFTRTDIKNLIVMKKEDFIKMNKDCERLFLSDVYDNVKAKKMDITHEYNEIIYRRVAINMSQGVPNQQEEAFTDKESKEYIDLLNKGESFLKYGNYSTPHERFFRLSEDKAQLLWWDESTCVLFQSFKSIDIEKIKDIYVGASSSKVFERFNIPFDDDQKCFSIVTDKRTIDLQNNNESTTRKWLFALKFLIRKAKSVKQLNHPRVSSAERESIITEVWSTEIIDKWSSYRNYVLKDLRDKTDTQSSKKNKKKSFTLSNQNMTKSNGGERLFDQAKFFSIWSFGIPKLFRKKLWPIVIGNSSCVTENLVKYYIEQIETIDFNQFDQEYNNALVNNDNDNGNGNKSKGYNSIYQREKIKYSDDIILNEILNDIIKISSKKLHLEISQENIDKIAFMSDLFKIVRVFLLYRPDVTFSKQLVYIAAIFLLNSDNYFQAFINLTNFTLSSYVIKFMKNNESFVSIIYIYHIILSI